MNRMTSEDENKLVASVEQAISLTHRGLSPNDAITKVAEERQLGPEVVRRMAEAFNKSKSVFVLKQAGAERLKSFDLADADVILRKIYEVPEQKTAAGGTLARSEMEFAGLDQLVTRFEKAAKTEAPATPELAKLPPASILRRLEKYAHVCKGLQDQLYAEMQGQRLLFDRGLDELTEQMSRMSVGEFCKTAQMLVNGFAETGPRLLAIVEHRTRRPLPKLEKTANAVIFPTKEPFLTVARIYDAAEKFAQLEQQYEQFRKEAGEGQAILHSFLATTAANALSNSGCAADGLQKIAEGPGMMGAMLAGFAGSTLSGLGVEPERAAEILSSGRRKAERPLEEVLSPPFSIG